MCIRDRIYSRERNLLKEFAQEADPIDMENGHARAAYRIMKGFSEILGTDAVDPARLSIEQIQTCLLYTSRCV